MNLAEKIVFLRKKNSLSQEELAEKLDVTRQSVSKWESGQSVPDLNKIIQIGELFGISLDLLLKDDTGEWDIFFSSGSSFSQSGNTAENDFPDEENKKIKRLDLKSTDDFLEKSKKNARLYAIATFLFIISPMLLMTLCARDYGSESKQAFAVVIGIVSLLSIVAIGVGILIYTSFKNQEFSFVYKNLFSLDGSAKVSVSEKKREFEPLFYKRIIIGVILCIFAVIPLICFALLFADYVMYGLLITILTVAVAVIIFVYNTTLLCGFNRILGEGEFSKENREKEEFAEKISAVYWTILTAIYLIYSFISSDWGRSWIVWPIGAVLYAAFYQFVFVFYKKGRNKTIRIVRKTDKK